MVKAIETVVPVESDVEAVKVLSKTVVATPDGLQWMYCNHHHGWKPRAEYSLDSRDGYHAWCNDCSREHSRQYARNKKNGN